MWVLLVVMECAVWKKLDLDWWMLEWLGEEKESRPMYQIDGDGDGDASFHSVPSFPCGGDAWNAWTSLSCACASSFSFLI